MAGWAKKVPQSRGHWLSGPYASIGIGFGSQKNKRLDQFGKFIFLGFLVLFGLLSWRAVIFTRDPAPGPPLLPFVGWSWCAGHRSGQLCSIVYLRTVVSFFFFFFCGDHSIFLRFEGKRVLLGPLAHCSNNSHSAVSCLPWMTFDVFLQSGSHRRLNVPGGPKENYFSWSIFKRLADHRPPTVFSPNKNGDRVRHLHADIRVGTLFVPHMVFLAFPAIQMTDDLHICTKLTAVRLMSNGRSRLQSRVFDYDFLK